MTSTINIRTDRELKTQAQNTLTATKNTDINSIFGAAKDKMWMSDDFDEPLDELNGYMQ